MQQANSKLMYLHWSLQRRYTEMIVGFFLFISSLQWAKYLRKNVITPDVWDEVALYLHRGLTFHSGDFQPFNAQEGPFYSIWYAILAFIEPDPLRLYYLNGYLICLLIPISIYILCLNCKMGVFSSYFASILFMLFPPIVTISRWPSHFLILFLTIGFAWVFKQKTKDLFYGCACIISGIASFIRPEIQISFYIFFSLFIIHFLRGHLVLNGKEKLLRLYLSIPSISFIFIWVKQLFFTQAFNKSLFVFQDFSALRDRESLNQQIDPKLLFKFAYGNVSGPLSAAISNPKEFFNHLEFSLGVFIASFFRFIRSYQILVDSKLGQIFTVGLLCTICFFLFSNFVGFNNKNSEDITSPAKDGFSTIFILTFPILLSCLVFGTVPRYLLPIVAVLVILLATRIRREWRFPSILFSIFCSALVCFVPIDFTQHSYLLNYYGFDNTPRIGASAELADILFLREIKLVEQKKIIASHFPGFLYVQDGIGLDLCWNNYAECPENKDSYLMNVNSFRSNIFNFNILLLTKSAQVSIENQMHPGPLRDSFLHFLQRPSAFGFRKYSIPCSTDFIYVKDSAIGRNNLLDTINAYSQNIQSCKSLAFSK